MNLSEILKDSEYKLSQFKTDEVAWLESSIFLKSSAKGDVPYIKCLVRGKDIKLSPEEAVRQLYLKVLCDRYLYPISRIQVEYGVNFGREVKRADIVVMDKNRPNTVYIVVEVKKPKLKDGKEQLKSYCHGTGAPIAVWTNGEQISYYQRNDPNHFEPISDIPNANQKLSDIVGKPFTLNDLIVGDKLVKEKKSLKTLIQEMEDEVLANAGVDVFEELFKLIFTKLYDEWYSGQGKRRSTRCLEFRNTGQTEGELKTKIQDLFDRAKKKWEGIFSEDVKISLAPSHFRICVASLQDVKLFNSNMEVIDEAFEYLMNKNSKDDKGQYFTPRYVIDMCVKMLNPKEDEYAIDTAAGSSGFPVHAIFHVWKNILKDEGLEVSHLFSLEDKPIRCKEYVEDRVFAIDFDEKAVRVARTLNLIAGDGQTNVLQLNTLDYEMWDEIAEQEDWQSIYFTGFNRLKKLRPKGSKDYRDFGFDVLMANPPFAGEIKEPRIIYHYELAKKSDGKWQTKMGRDILFIERNLDFLKAGGRMAVVLPQGRFNNSSDKNIRDFIAERCRILAVVGLHGNTFKPHTGTKTSVLFVQKWNDDPKAGALCPRRDDYNIFFATMRKTGKDNSGDKIYVKKPDGSGEFLLDDHEHLIVDHDLFNHDGKTQDGIAEAFIEFATKEGLSFFDLGSSVMPFDAKKYNWLMDELEVNSVKLSSVLNDNDSFRFDSEYFQKIYLQTTNLLKKFQIVKVGEIAKVSDGDHSKFPDDQKQEIKYLQAKDIKNYFLEEDNPVYISREYFLKNSRSHIGGENILLSIMGTVGDITITPKDFEPCLSNRALAIIKNIKRVDPYFLFAYLITDQTTTLVNRLKNGGVQERINLDVLGKLEIPILSTSFQKLVREIVLLGYKTRDSSKSIYQQAEDLLLSELGLKDWQPTDENIAVKSFSASFGISGRLDAEHYQPKYDDLINEIHSNSLYVRPIKDIQNYNSRGLQPIYSDNGTLNVINSRHILEQHLDYDNFEKADSINWDSQEKSRVYENDILIYTTGANIGRTNVYLSNQKAIASNHVNILRLKEESQIYVGFVISSIIGRLQTEKLSAGSAQAELYPKDIDNFVIPFVDKKIQKQISDNYVFSFVVNKQSKQLLEIAKTIVEKAIETNEETAINWGNEQLKILNIQL